MKTLLFFITMSLLSFTLQAQDSDDGETFSLTTYQPGDEIGTEVDFSFLNDGFDYLESDEGRDTNEDIRTSSCSRTIGDGSGFSLRNQSYTIQGNNTNTRIGLDGTSLEVIRDYGCAEGVGGSRVSMTSRFSVDMDGNASFRLSIPLYGGQMGSYGQ